MFMENTFPQTPENYEQISNSDIEPIQKPRPISITYGYSRVRGSDA